MGSLELLPPSLVASCEVIAEVVGLDPCEPGPPTGAVLPARTQQLLSENFTYPEALQVAADELEQLGEAVSASEGFGPSTWRLWSRPVVHLNQCTLEQYLRTAFPQR